MNTHDKAKSKLKDKKKTGKTPGKAKRKYNGVIKDNGKMNTKPEIYTEQWIENELETILEEIKTDTTKIFKGDIFDNKEYSEQRYSEWCKKFPDNEKISELIKKINEVMENRLLKAGAENKLNATIVIWTDKIHYNRSDKQEIKHSGLKPLEITVDSEDKKKKIEENL